AAARSMWRRAVRWVYHVWPTDPEGGALPGDEDIKEPETVVSGVRRSEE
ncbi:MAG: hypothetical protein IT329_21355, partial [Caldilineaceae bacterium]|nr:hypothetical protein [Caldilineaceae bacterium]